MRLIDITGQVFGRLTVVSKDPKPCMWLCRCVCGSTTLATGTNLRRGNTTSCGCVHREQLVAYNQTAKSLEVLWQADMNFYRRKLSYRRNRKAKGLGSNQFVKQERDTEHIEHPSLIWDLTLEQYRSLVTADCHYCGQPPNQKPQGSRMPTGTYRNGIDRVDNDKGYIPDNCVSCCVSCNRAKRALSLAAFVEETSRRYEHMVRTGLLPG